MTSETKNDRLADIRAVAEEAGRVILDYYEAGTTVRRKADESPVTEADETAERLILARLEGISPGIPIVAEEAMEAGRVPDISEGRFWLVDPLDGTREFLSRNGEFTVNIALVEDGVPVLGVVHAPAKGLTFAAHGPDSAVRWRDGGAPEPISARAVPPQGAVVVASRSHGDPDRLAAYLAGRRVQATVEAGSSVKFCLVAAGEADLYPRFGRTMEWDTAAGHAVLLAAGGEVETEDGRPLRYGKRGFENPPFIARGLV